MPVDYTWTAQNGNKFTNVIEVLEDHTYADDLDMNTIGNTVKGNYTWKNEWYVNRDGSGTKIDYDVDKPNGNDITIYGKWVSTITRNNNGAGAATPNVEILKGQQIGAVNLPTLSSAYTWRGWFKEAGFTNAVTASWVPTGNAVVYAKWTSVVILYASQTHAEEFDPGVGFINRYVTNYVLWKQIEVLKGQSTYIGDNGYAANTDYRDQPLNLNCEKRYRTVMYYRGNLIVKYQNSYTPNGNITLWCQYQDAKYNQANYN